MCPTEAEAHRFINRLLASVDKTIHGDKTGEGRNCSLGTCHSSVSIVVVSRAQGYFGGHVSFGKQDCLVAFREFLVAVHTKSWQ